ncbi:MAG: Hpt domain-containing protein [Verrucomicrobiota bacterium]
MDPTPNDQPAPLDESSVVGLPFGAAKPFKPGAAKLAPKLKPAEVPSELKAPALKLSPKPAAAKPLPKLAPSVADEAIAAQPSLPGKALPPRIGKPLPKLTPVPAESQPPSLPAKPFFKSPPALVASEPSIPPELTTEKEEDDLNEIFREEVESYLPEIVDALNVLAGKLENDEAWKQLKTKYHALKGAANTVGLPDLGASAAAAEKKSLSAIENPDQRSIASRDQLIETLHKMTTALDIPFPDIDSCTVRPQPTKEENAEDFAETVSSKAETEELSAPDIEPVLIAFSEWSENGGDSSREQFLSETLRFQEGLNPKTFSGLHRSFSQLLDFCRKPLPTSPPPSIFSSVITHALNDARIYLQAKRYNPKLNWSRKWHFYFSSLQIALASQTESGGTLPEARDPEMVEAFLEETGDNLQHIEEALMAWENGDQPDERQKELRRYYHTLKGAANSVGLTRLGADFHILEDAMDKADPETAAREFLPHLFTCLDETRRYVELLQANPQSPWPGNWNALLHPDQIQPDSDASKPAEMAEAIDPDMLEVFVEETENLLEPIESATMALEAGEEAEKQQGILRRHFHTLKGAANSVGLTGLGAEFHALEDFMDGELSSTDSSQLTSFLLQCLDQLRAYTSELQSNPKVAWPYHWMLTIDSLKKGESPSSTATVPAGSPAAKAPAAEKQMLRVEAGQLQELMHMISELVAEQSKVQHYVLGLRTLSSDLQKLYADDSLDNHHRTKLKKLSEETNQIREAIDNDDQLFRRYSKRIQSDLLGLNMGPVGSLFHRLSRSFRDACKEEKKEATWAPEGSDVQLDRSVVDQLYGPLLHVVRNAVAHGIESPDKRRELGKDSSGTVKIQAISKADHVIIEISDDGAGISTDGVRRKAIEKGLLDESAPSITSEEAVELLFSPGFSTKDAVSNVAGRGVGLDVVKGDIESLNGSVGVQNFEGRGTTWIIRVPLTLSASEALLVHAGDFKVALPLSMVDRCTGLSPGHMESSSLFGKISIDETPIPLLNLSCFLGSKSQVAPTHAVVIDSGLERAAVAVTALDTRREIVMKDLGPLLASLAFYSGVTSDVDGRLLPVLQIPYLLQWITKHHSSPAVEGPDSPESEHINSDSSNEAIVLLADDSPSVRKVQEKQLSQLGFKVFLAKDGQEAIDSLKINHFDLLITDWEMPRVNGAQLVRSTRENEITRDLPIIVISSKVNDEFEQEALKLGATACLAKPFQADQFLQKLKATDKLESLMTKLDGSTQDKA